eukprot:m.138427 g.138427  ORF g.138427 m.138427 type:complete len:313 (+) comp22725_c0_seq1:322-1260(+)
MASSVVGRAVTEPTTALGPAPSKMLKKVVTKAGDGWESQVEIFAAAGGNVNASVNGGGDTLLHLACRHGAGAAVVAGLLRVGAAVELENAVGHRAIHEAALCDDAGTVEAVIAGAAEVDALKHAGWTPLMLAASKTGPVAVSIVQQLVGAEARSDLRNKDGWNAVQVAARAGSAAVVRVLLDCQGGTGATNVSNNGRTPLMTAAPPDDGGFARAHSSTRCPVASPRGDRCTRCGRFVLPECAALCCDRGVGRQCGESSGSRRQHRADRHDSGWGASPRSSGRRRVRVLPYVNERSGRQLGSAAVRARRERYG